MKRQASTNKNMWQIQKAKAQFSLLVKDANSKGFQVITKNGEPIAVMISKKEFDRLTHDNSSMLEFFQQAPYQEIELQTQRLKDLPRDLDL